MKWSASRDAVEVTRQMHASPIVRPVVTGIGPICAGGIGRDELLSTLARGSPAERLTAGGAPLHDPRSEGLPVDPFPLFRPEPRAIEALLTAEKLSSLPLDPELRLAALAARLALRDASPAVDDTRRTALVVTYEAPGMDRLLRNLFEDFALAPEERRAPADSPGARFQRFYQHHKEAAYSTHSFLHLHLLARELGIHGHTLFVNNACASGLYALEAGASLLRESKADRVVVIGAESPAFPSKYLWFKEAGLCAKDGSLCPFDVGRSGLVLGEGAAALVLEPMDKAKARGARSYGEYLGGDFNQEGWKVTTPNFVEPFYEEVIRGACRTAGIEPAEVDAIFAHGAGTGLSDAYEAKGIVAVFGEWPERPAIVALKGYFGHTLGACSLLEVAVTALALEQGFLPASPGFSLPDPKLKLRVTTHTVKPGARTALKLANGFAGFNAAVVLRRPEVE